MNKFTVIKKNPVFSGYFQTSIKLKYHFCFSSVFFLPILTQYSAEFRNLPRPQCRGHESKNGSSAVRILNAEPAQHNGRNHGEIFGTEHVYLMLIYNGNPCAASHRTDKFPVRDYRSRNGVDSIVQRSEAWQPIATMDHDQYPNGKERVIAIAWYFHIIGSGSPPPNGNHIADVIPDQVISSRSECYTVWKILFSLPSHWEISSVKHARSIQESFNSDRH